jgi:ABC-type uncharacterized transport system auxiliary subunit
MRKLSLAFVCAALMVGCAPKEKMTPICEFMPTIATKRVASTQNIGAKVVKIKTTTAQKAYLGGNMWYKKGLERASFGYSKWMLPPNQLVTIAIENSAEESGVFRSVIAVSSQASNDIIIESALVDFYQDFVSDSSDAVVTVKINLISTTNGKLLASKKFEYRQKCKTNDAAGGVNAFSEIFGSFAIDVSAWIKEVYK